MDAPPFGHQSTWLRCTPQHVAFFGGGARAWYRCTGQQGVASYSQPIEEKEMP
jgi:hypothetical protein